MPQDPCDIDSFSGSHATGLGSARISCFLPVFSSSVLEIPTQFPSPPARTPRARVHPSALGDPFHPLLLSVCFTLPVHRRLQTHGLTCCLLFAPCVCLCLWRADSALRRKHGRAWLARGLGGLDSIKKHFVFLSTSTCFVDWMVFWAVRRSEALS